MVHLIPSFYNYRLSPPPTLNPKSSSQIVNMPVSKKTKSTKKLIYNSATKDFKVISEEEFNRLPTTPDEVNFIPGKKSANIEVPGSFEAPYPGAPSDSETPKRKTIHVPVWLRPVIEWENITTVYVL